MQRRTKDLSRFFLLVGILLIANYLLTQRYWKIDLTEDNRFTLSESTVKLLEGLDAPVDIEIFLDGPLNAEFTAFQERIREMGQQFRAYSHGTVRFNFFDPNSILDPKQRATFLREITQKGLPATTLFNIVDGERKESIIFPGGLVKYKDKEEAVLLLKGNKARSSEEQLTQSIEGLEYELASAIYRLTNPRKKRIAYIQGHGTANAEQTLELDRVLTTSFDISQIALDSSVFLFDALLFPRPTEPFSDRELFFLDQYLTGGGNALFLLDPIQMNIDSIPIGGTYAFARNNTGLEQILFRSGIRVEHTLLQDLQAGRIEVVTGQRGTKPNAQFLPWPYYIYFNRFSEHPIVRNLDVVLGKFVSRVDTIATPNTRKTPLIFSSDYSRVKEMPGRVSIDEIREIKEDRATFNKKQVPVAWLVEGTYPTQFTIRFPPKGIAKDQIRTKSIPGKLVVVGDGNLVISDRDRRTGKPIPVSFDPATRQPLSNVEFIQNALYYLTDAEGVINARRKAFRQRPLDRVRAREESTFWQVINIGSPLVLLLLVGVFVTLYRRWRWRR